MTVDRAKVRRSCTADINRQVRSELRTSDLVLAVVGLAVLGGLCLLGLANWIGEAQGLASMPALTATEVL